MVSARLPYQNEQRRGHFPYLPSPPPTCQRAISISMSVNHASLSLHRARSAGECQSRALGTQSRRYRPATRPGCFVGSSRFGSLSQGSSIRFRFPLTPTTSDEPCRAACMVSHIPAFPCLWRGFVPRSAYYLFPCLPYPPSLPLPHAGTSCRKFFSLSLFLLEPAHPSRVGDRGELGVNVSMPAPQPCLVSWSVRGGFLSSQGGVCLGKKL